ncbi:MAG: Lon protease-like protein [Planctomycetota bacterium]
MDFELTTIKLPNGPVPMFPLPGVFLFPHQVLPLHIFEDRYRTMVADLLDGPGRLVIAAPVLGESASPGHVPAVIPVAGLGEILRHEKLDDGRYMIWVLGISRVHIQELECETPYRQVEVLPFLETEVPAPEAEDLTRELRDAAAARLKEPLPLPDSTPPGLLADLLMQTLQASRDLVERAFVEPNVQARAQLALREAERRGALGDDDDPKVTVQIDREEGPAGAFHDPSYDFLDDLPSVDDEVEGEGDSDSSPQDSPQDTPQSSPQSSPQSPPQSFPQRPDTSEEDGGRQDDESSSDPLDGPPEESPEEPRPE